MNRLNPLYLLFLSAVIALFAIYSAKQEQQKLEDLQSEYRFKREIALKLKALKNAYSPKRQREILRLLRTPKVKKSGVKFQSTKEHLTITGRGIDVKTANMITAKLLNGTYNIKEFELKKQKEGVDLKMETVWR